MIQNTYGTMYFVDDMKTAVNELRQSLGIEPSHESADWTEFNLGGHNLCLHIKGDDEHHTQNGVLIFNLNEVKGSFKKMQDEGHNVFGLKEIHPGGWTFHLKDSSHNEYSFYGKP